MIVPDANLLIYAYDTSVPSHKAARQWWEKCLSGDEPVGLPWVVVLAFVRLTTHPVLMEQPFTIEEAQSAVDGWLARSHVQLLHPRTSTLNRFFSLLHAAGLGGNLSTDALIAAHAEEYGAVVHSTDRDFDRFPPVRWVNPIDRKPRASGH
jgi:toxin-antitoxin system PIN domain toxin